MVNHNWTTGTNTAVNISTDGITMQPGTDIKVGGRSLMDAIDKMEERLGILNPNPELEDRWDQLRNLRNQYMELEIDLSQIKTNIGIQTERDIYDISRNEIFYQKEVEQNKIPNELSLTEIVGKINQDEIKRITVINNNLEITYQDETKAFSTKEAETAFSQTLINYGVDLEKLKNIEIEYVFYASTII
jgi:hypothetical protein